MIMDGESDMRRNGFLRVALAIALCGLISVCLALWWIEASALDSPSSPPGSSIVAPTPPTQRSAGQGHGPVPSGDVLPGTPARAPARQSSFGTNSASSPEQGGATEYTPEGQPEVARSIQALQVGARDTGKPAPPRQLTVWPLTNVGLRNGFEEVLDVHGRDCLTTPRSLELKLGLEIENVEGVGQVNVTTIQEVTSGEIPAEADCLIEALERIQIEPPPEGAKGVTEVTYRFFGG